MAIRNASLNMVDLLLEGLEREVKEVVTEELVKKEMAEFEAKLRERIEPLVNKLSFQGIESVKDMMRIRDELHVYLHWDESQPVVGKV